jgi:hypothetical protein
VLQFVANSKECVDRIPNIGLLFSFQRPSFTNRIELRWIRSLATAGSRGRPCWFKSGRRKYVRRSLLSRGRCEENSAALPTEGPGVLHRPLRHVKLSSLFLLAVSASKGGASIPSPGSPSSGRPEPPDRPIGRGALCSRVSDRCQGPVAPPGPAAPRHEPAAATSRRHWAAALSARGSARPARRARAAATISSSRARAASTSSLSSTYW